MNFKKTLVLILLLLGGVVLGTMLTSVCASVPWLSFLTAGQTVGVGVPNPITIDIGIATVSFGFSVSVNIIKILSILGCLWLYKIFSKGL